MKKLLLTLGLFVVLTAPAEARQRRDGWCMQGTAIQVTSLVSPFTFGTLQQSYLSCTVTVFVTGSGGTLATIYADNIGTPLANPFTAGANGYWFYYANDGHYDTQLSGAAIPTPFTIGDAQLVGQLNDVVNGVGMSYPLGGSIQIGINPGTGTADVPESVDVTLNGANIGGLTAHVFVKLKTDAATTAVSAILYNVSDNVNVGQSAATTNTTLTDLNFVATLSAAGSKVYRLQLNSNNGGAFIYGTGYLQLSNP